MELLRTRGPGWLDRLLRIFVGRRFASVPRARRGDHGAGRSRAAHARLGARSHRARAGSRARPRAVTSDDGGPAGGARRTAEWADGRYKRGRSRAMLPVVAAPSGQWAPRRQGATGSYPPWRDSSCRRPRPRGGPSVPQDGRPLPQLAVASGARGEARRQSLPQSEASEMARRSPEAEACATSRRGEATTEPEPSTLARRACGPAMPRTPSPSDRRAPR
jgi:hypothetical protein